MNAFDVLETWGMKNISPALKITTMVILLAIKHKANTVTMSRNQEDAIRLVYTPLGFGECEMVPPPRHLFWKIVKCLQLIGSEAAKNPASHFKISYSNTWDESKIVVSIEYNTGDDIYEETEFILRQVHEEEGQRGK